MPVVGYEDDYAVSDKGRVWSNISNKLLKLIDKKDGRLIVFLRRKAHYVHRLVLEAFEGPGPKGTECCHFDGNGHNNTIENLRWDSRIKNMADARRHGTMIVGSRHCRAKLDEEKVKIIKYQIQTGCLQTILASLYNVHLSTICDIANGRTWKHV